MSDEQAKTETVSTPPNPKIDEIDRMALELAKSRRMTALKEAEKALAQNETAEIAYKYVVLQLYMKYSLNEADALTEAGEIIKGGAAAAQQKQGS